MNDKKSGGLQMFKKWRDHAPWCINQPCSGQNPFGSSSDSMKMGEVENYLNSDNSINKYVISIKFYSFQISGWKYFPVLNLENCKITTLRLYPNLLVFMILSFINEYVYVIGLLRVSSDSFCESTIRHTWVTATYFCLFLEKMHFFFEERNCKYAVSLAIPYF